VLESCYFDDAALLWYIQMIECPLRRGKQSAV